MILSWRCRMDSRQSSVKVAQPCPAAKSKEFLLPAAFLKDAPIVILDEATASVDTDNESYIQEAINELVKGKTLLVIAHRLNTICQADQILVIADGRISEQGTHDELIAKAGIYQDFVNIRKKVLRLEPCIKETIVKIHASGEDYLEAVLVLQKNHGAVRSIDVARRVGVSKASVSYAVSALREGGFLTVDSDYVLHLTETGRNVAEKKFMSGISSLQSNFIAAGVDPEIAERDACPD